MLTAIPSYKVLKDWKYFSNTMVLFKRSEQKAQDHLKKKKVSALAGAIGNFRNLPISS